MLTHTNAIQQWSNIYKNKNEHTLSVCLSVFFWLPRLVRFSSVSPPCGAVEVRRTHSQKEQRDHFYSDEIKGASFSYPLCNTHNLQLVSPYLCTNPHNKQLCTIILLSLIWPHNWKCTVYFGTWSKISVSWIHGYSICYVKSYDLLSAQICCKVYSPCCPIDGSIHWFSLFLVLLII